MDLEERVLRRARTIAVVGASRYPDKVAHQIPQRMQQAGFRIIPVNPYADTLFGEPVYRTLADVPDAIDLVDVFRPSAQAAAVVQAAVEIGAKAVWLQQGIVSAEGRRIADAAGVDYVEDECIGVARARYAIMV